MRNNEIERPEINAAEVRAKAIYKKVSAYFDTDKVQSLVEAYGTDALANAEAMAKAFTEVAEQKVPEIMKLVSDDLGLEISYDEAVDALKAVLTKKLHVEVAAEEPAPTDTSTEIAETDPALVNPPAAEDVSVAE